MKRRNNAIKCFITILILFIISWVVFSEYTSMQINEVQYSIDKVSNVNDVIKENIVKNNVKEYPKENVIQKYNGFEVIAQLKIPAIELETYILKNFSNEALNVSVTKFWGSEPNTPGNLCVAGHNFKNKNMFKKLKNLKVEDIFTISDNNIGKIEYKIYSIYRVKPDDVSCLSQETNGLKEVTLITCTDNSKERIIVKAREKI